MGYLGKQLVFTIILSLGILATNSVYANQHERKLADAAQLQGDRIVQFSKLVEQSLAQRGARVAIVSRVGRPRSSLPNNIHYTHVGIWVYSDIKTADGRIIKGYQIYNLYQDNVDYAKSNLVNDFPLDFFARAHDLDAGIIIPKPELQHKILNLLASGGYKQLHNERYSVLSNPSNSKYQNCTELVLDIVMAALYGTTNKTTIKANINAYYKPQTISLGLIKDLFGPMLMEDLQANDHRGMFKTATFTTLTDFMREYDLAEDIFAIRYKYESFREDAPAAHACLPKWESGPYCN